MLRTLLARLERRRKPLLIGGAAFLLYTAFGFLVAPLIVKGQLEQALSAATGQRATVAEVQVNPLALSVRLTELRVEEADGSPLFGVGGLLVNFEASSAFRAAFVFDEIAISGPWVEAVVLPDATLNLSRIGSKAPAPPPSAVPTEPPSVLIGTFKMVGGRIDYEDRTRPEPSRVEVRIVDLAAADLSTRRGEAGQYELEATGERAHFKWRGEVGFNPIASRGTVSIADVDLASMQREFLAERIAGEVRSGMLEMSTDYAVMRREDGEFDLKLSEGKVALLGFAFGAAGAELAALELPKVLLSGAAFDLAARGVQLGRIVVAEPVLRARRDAAGLDLAALVAPPPLAEPEPAPTPTTVSADLGAAPSTAAAAPAPATAPTPATAPAAAEPGPSAAPWKVGLAELLISAARVELTDATPATPVVHSIAPLALTLRDTTLAPSLRTDLLLEAGINGGTLKVEGPVALEDPKPLQAELVVVAQRIGIAPLAPYLAELGRFDLLRGSVEAEGKLTLADGAIGYSGYAGSTGLALRDQALKEDFLRYKRLQVRGIEAKVPPAPALLALSIKEVVLEQPYLRLVVGPDRITNIDHILGTGRPANPADGTAAPAAEDEGEPAAEAAPPAQPGPAPKAANAPVPKVRVASVRIVDGSANFADRSLTPAFATAIGELNGTIKGLSSAEKTEAEVVIDGRVDRYAPVALRGRMNPLAAKVTTDLALSFKDIELTTFTPYSGRFMGMKIQQGRLSLDLRYKLVDRALEGENKIVLDQFTLGENVESSEALALPVRLAIALLKDSRGVIDLDLPVKGSLDDPQFSYGKIMWKAFVSLITKAVAAPFAALGSLFGGGPDLEKVAFAPGSTIPDPAQQAQLDTIAKGLAAKPELRLDVPGASDVALDGAVIARKKVLARVRPDGSAVDAAVLTPKEQRALAGLFAARFPDLDPKAVLPQAPDGPEPTPVALATEQLARLVAVEPDDPAALGDLARARAMAIKDYMVTRGGLAPERIYLKDTNAVAVQKDGQVVLTLELTAP